MPVARVADSAQSTPEPTPRTVRVLVDVPAVDRAFDYRWPMSAGAQGVGAPVVGTVVRVPLAGRRVRGWVVGLDVESPEGLALAEVSAVVGHGPATEVLELARWASWRWAGRPATFARLGTPKRIVRTVPPLRVRPPRSGAAHPPTGELVRDALGLGAGAHAVEVSPSTDLADVAAEAAVAGQCIVVTPSVDESRRVVTSLRRRGAAVASWPDDWAAAASGATVVGGRSAVFAPAPALAAIVVGDEHDERLQSESSPTWHARELAVERAARAGVPCLLVSPCPSLEALALAGAPGSSPADGDGTEQASTAPPGPAVSVSRAEQRSGWAPVTVVDRRGEDTGRTGLYSSRVVEAIRSVAGEGGRAVCVLNRTGRARLLACRSCGSLAECDRCGAAVVLTEASVLRCGRCGSQRPGVCAACGSAALSLLRVGVARAREELEALVRRPVAAVTGADRPGDDTAGHAAVVVGTEAVLHRGGGADLVVVLDLDQELLAPRYRAAEECMALLVLATRLVGGRTRGGRMMLQTRLPDHEVVRAALGASPRPVTEAEHLRRTVLGFPPAATIAVVGGEAAPSFVEGLGDPDGVDVLGPEDGRWILRSRDRGVLLDALASVQRPSGRLRLRVDPARVG